GRISGFLHQCRTVCRRAELTILALAREEALNPFILKYVNRLSDLFFVLSRWVGKRLGENEYLWERGLQPRPRKKGPSGPKSGPTDDPIPTPTQSRQRASS